MGKRKIASIEIIKPGSNPDIDTDFSAEARDAVVAHAEKVNGEDKVASIVTLGTLRGKSAFKQMCTIYEIPFSAANKISALYPDAINGETASLIDLYDPKSTFYNAGADFRDATSDGSWVDIIAGAKAIENRNKSTGVHPCGIIISSKPLDETIPLMVSKKDGRTLTQWVYKDLESIGLIKFDFLTLASVDLLQLTLNYIIEKGEQAPNLLKLFQGERNDPKTIDLLRNGRTVGIFQFESPGMQELLKRMGADSFEDLVASNALYRPGPMDSNAHIEYADRRAGRSKPVPLHPEFEGTVLDEILGNTEQIIAYQEQIMQIANRIAGMTLQEGDELRSAMGKKKMAVMNTMKPRFIKGGQANGFSADAMNTLWNVMEPFAGYAFNKSHSVAYSLNAYATAYLKANYPIEFMAAIIALNVDDKDKTLTFLKEASSMGLKMGPVDINSSNVMVAPDYTGNTDYDIIYGIGGIKAISETNAKVIVEERLANGPFTSTQDAITRCQKAGVNNRKVFENLALAGAFDSFNVPRRQVVEKLPSLLTDAKTSGNMGANLFDMFGDSSSVSISLDGPEYSFSERVKKEADVVGMYISAHPLSKAGKRLDLYRNTTIHELLSSNKRAQVTIIGAVTEIVRRNNRRGGKSIRVSIDDNTGYLEANLYKNIVKGIDKNIAQERIKVLYEKGENIVTKEQEALIFDNTIAAIDSVELNSVYAFNIAFRPGFDNSPPSAFVVNIKPVLFSSSGELPLRLRVPDHLGSSSRRNKIYDKLPKALANKFPGTTPILIAKHGEIALPYDDSGEFVSAVMEMGADFRAERKVASRSWPPKTMVSSSLELDNNDNLFQKMIAVDNIDYVDSGYTFSGGQEANAAIEKYLGFSNYDYGSTTPEIVDSIWGL